MIDKNLILFIDDDEADIFLNSIAIQNAEPNIKIIAAHDGEEALNLLSSLEQQPAIIFLDINMPRMNGFEFLEHYDKAKIQPTVVFLLSSSDHESDKKKAEAFECVQGYVVKPLNETELTDLIQTLT
jgi:CheY-like chemotaxis protein